jgi:hypothetical protein
VTASPRVHPEGSSRSGVIWRLPRTAAALVGAAVLVLSACSTDLHPGNAAVVDGTAISQGQIDDLVSAGCAYETEMGKVDRQTYPVLSISDLRTNFANVLIRDQLARDAADKIGDLHVSQDQVAKFASNNTIPTTLDEPEKARITEFFRKSAETELLVALIGAHLKDDSVTDASHVQQADLDAGNKYLATYSNKADVSVNPSLGSWTGSKIEAGTGSLSELARTPASPSGNPAETLPPSQQCG